MRPFMLLFILISFFLSCESDTLPPIEKEPEEEEPVRGTEVVVSEVNITGSAGSYTFSVTLSSPDTGCDQYADWWEVFRTDGSLVYRRILAHSHVNEQPFSRSGSGINIQATDSVYVRGHMNNLGYGTQVYSGTVAQGLNPTTVDKEFFSELADKAPLPAKCDF